MKPTVSMLSILLILLPFFPVAQLPPYVPTNSLAAWYPFDGNFNDLSGHGNVPSNSGVAFTTDRWGNPGMAADFNGTTSVLTLSTPSFTFSETGGFSYSFWVNKGTQNSAGVVLMSGNNAAGNFISNIQGMNEMQFGVNKQQSAWVWATCPHNLNTWDHYVAVYDAGAMRLYKNGVLSGSATFVNFGTTSINLPFYFGRGIQGGANFYKGALDDVGIWTRALTQQEITSLYTTFVGVNSLPDENMFSLYPNPSKEKITLSSAGNSASFDYFISDISGKIVLKGSTESQKTIIDIRSLKEGIYYLKIAGIGTRVFRVSAN